MSDSVSPSPKEGGGAEAALPLPLNPPQCVERDSPVLVAIPFDAGSNRTIL